MIQTKKIEKTDKEEIVSEVVAATRGMFVEFQHSFEKYLERNIETAIESLAQVTNKGFAEVHERIDGLEDRVETLGSRVGKMDEKIEDLRNDMNENFGKVRNDIFIIRDTCATREEVKKIAFRVTKLERSAT